MAKKETVYDVTKHALVPKHVKVSEKESETLLATYSISARELPRINFDDPAIQHLGVKEGDIIKIVRVNAQMGETVFYRKVTSA
ncbi:MAG: DNA-directed RNA polymerase subunit H [Nanoarchaeota archaeon]